MFDIGMIEILVVIIIMIIFIRPEDLPRVLYLIGQYIGKVRRFVSDIQQQIEANISVPKSKDIIDNNSLKNDISSIQQNLSDIPNITFKTEAEEQIAQSNNKDKN